MAIFDRIDYWYDKACQNYIRQMDRKKKELTDEDIREIQRYAGNHIGFFLAWIIKHHFEGEIHTGNKEAVEAVRKEEMLGVDFLLDYCDGKFWGDDVSEDIFPFVQSYYERYFSEYVNWVINELGELPMEFTGSWEDYHEFEKVLDRAYTLFRQS